MKPKNEYLRSLFEIWSLGRLHSLTSSICRISEVYFFENIYTFPKEYIYFQKSMPPTSLVARVLVNHFVAPVYIFEKVPARARLLTWRPAAWPAAFQVRQARPPPFLFPRVTTAAVLCIMASKADSAKINTSKQNELCGGRSGRISKADIEAPALRAT
jgi:hypothetical protein